METPAPAPTDLQLFSSTAAADDFAKQFTGVDSFGNGATFNFTTADDPSDAYARVGSVVSGVGYGADVNVAFAAFTALGAGFAQGYEAFSIKVRGTPNGRLEVKLFGAGEGNDSVANIELAKYAGAKNLGNGWYDVAIPFAEFTNPNKVASHSGYLIGMPGNNGADQFTFYFTDVELSALDPIGLTRGPAAPTELAANVKSLFSDGYAPAESAAWSTSWDRVNGPESVTLAGNNVVKKYTGVDVIGIEPATTLDIRTVDTLHIDVWRTDATADFKIKLVDFGANGVYGGGDDKEHELVFNAANQNAIPANQWVSLDIPLSELAGLTTKEHFAQLVMASTKGSDANVVASSETLWIDNVYFYNNVL